MTVTVNDAVALRPPLSVTVQLTVVGPIGKVDPDAGTQTAGIVMSSTSVPVTVKCHGRTDAPTSPAS